jgi:hypothetical protein
MLAGAEPNDVIAAMEKVLPAPIDHFLLQADLTVIVPGPLERDLADQLASVATVESAGAAMVYRISEASIRRALDSGRTASELHALFNRHSKTPVPQGLTYLIDDVARRHGQLRVGMAQSFVRCEDAALLAQAVAAPAAELLEMRLLAPTVAVSQAPISRCSPRCATPVSRLLPRTPPERSSTSVRAAPGCPRRHVAARPGSRRRPPARRLARSSRCCARWRPRRSGTCASTPPSRSRNCKRPRTCSRRW